jgi:hypothetical protein
MADTSQTFCTYLGYTSELFAIQMRNIEAMRLAQQKMLEGMGALARRQIEMLDGTFSRSLSAQPPSPTNIRAALIGQIDSFKTTILESQAKSNILSELAARSSGDVVNILQSRMMTALDEFKTALEQVLPLSLTAAAATTLVAAPVAART